MKLNKGDIVEIIEQFFDDDLLYKVGSKWAVASDHPNNLLIEVYDPRQQYGLTFLSHAKIKKVDLPKQSYNFKVGQVYKVIAQDGASPFKYDELYVVQPAISLSGNYILSEDGVKYYANDFGSQGLLTECTYLELVSDCKEPTPKPKEGAQEPTIEVQFLLDYIETEDLCSAEIKAFLKGYLKGERFKND